METTAKSLALCMVLACASAQAQSAMENRSDEADRVEITYAAATPNGLLNDLRNFDLLEHIAQINIVMLDELYAFKAGAKNAAALQYWELTPDNTFVAKEPYADYIKMGMGFIGIIQDLESYPVREREPHVDEYAEPDPVYLQY